MAGTCIKAGSRRFQRKSSFDQRGALVWSHILPALSHLDLACCPLGEEEKSGEQDIKDLVHDKTDEVERALVRTDDRLNELVVYLLRALCSQATCISTELTT